MSGQEDRGNRAAATGADLRVAWVMAGDLRPWRVPFVNELALGDDIELTVFHSAPRTKFGAPAQLPQASVAHVVELRDVLWPFVGQRTAWLRGTWKILRSGFDVIVCQETVHNMTTWTIALLQVFGFRFVLHGHFYRNTHKREGGLRIRGAARRLLAGRARAFLAYTDRGRDALIESGVPAEKVFVTRNTLDTERLMRIADGVTADDLVETRRSLDIENEPVLLMMGRLLPEKKVDVLIEAVRLMGDMQEDVVLIVIGDGVERRRLEEQAGGLRRVHFLGAIYDEAELAPYLLVSDLLVIPGRIGLTCVHGFTAGLPSVTGSAEVVHQSPEFDYIVDRTNGILVADLSPGAFAQAISEVLRDGDRLLDLSRAARRTAGSLSMRTMVEEFVKGVRYARHSSTSPGGAN